ncbi:MAG: 3-phosphoshikimate 1-carboxyvinyltransferase [Bacteroidota bacterium]
MFETEYRQTTGPCPVIQLPESKSESNRALILDYLYPGRKQLGNLSSASDTTELRKAIYAIKNSRDGSTEIHAGQGGTSFRFLMAALAVSPGEYLLKAHPQVLARPWEELKEGLTKLGADIVFNPDSGGSFTIKGKILEGGELSLSHDTSSQFASSLMMSGACMRSGISVKFKKKPVSFPYLMMTANLMQEFDLRVRLNEKGFRVWPASLSPGTFPFPWSAEADWSSAAFFYTALLLHPDLEEIFLEGLDLNSQQADVAAAEIFHSLGIESIREKNGVKIKKNKSAEPREYYDLSDCPDLFPPLSLALAFLGKTSNITGIQHLAVKESNRGAAMENTLWQMGYSVKFDGKMFSFYPHPAAKKQEAYPETLLDHRLCMTYALLPLISLETKIKCSDHPDVCAKSFPDFFHQAEKIGLFLKS